MANEKVLKTFLHVSDLHIDDEPASRRGGPYDKKVEWYIRRHRIMDGLLGHSYPALRSLEDFLLYRDLRNEDASIIVTGDLTRNGRPKQLEIARDFLEARMKSPHGRAGLAQRDSGERTICGNHDHWPGRNFGLGQPLIDIKNEFRLPRILDFPLTDQWRVEFLLLNSDINIGHWSFNKFPMAKGHLSSDLQDMSQQLDNHTSGNKHFRVLVIHHSFFYSNSWGFSEIRDISKRALARFVIKYNIDVVLSGHIHEPMITTKWIKALPASKRIMEARCGTTSRLEGLPKRWGRPYVPLEQQSLIVHKVVQQGSELYWNAEAYFRSPTARGRFVSTGSLASMRVWPRNSIP